MNALNLDIVANLNLIDAINQDVALQQQLIGQEALVKIDLLNEPSYFLEDQKTIWTVMANVLVDGIESISEQTINEIEIIANKCPLEYDKIVFEARSLLGVLLEDEITDYSDVDSACFTDSALTISSRNETDAKTEKLSVFPNPSKGGIYVDLNFDDLENAHLEILNVKGKVVIKKTIDSNSMYLDLSNFASGIFILKLIDVNGVKMESKKLILID